ncbi:hypothetical protein DCE93_07775 [Agromyces badenianii]|uniref:DUF4031 domain-containing protein n=1 Tax=Agromyces badenianii TaxID=2080742 RepID=A0A2S0WW70_9MICO|nr:hypothetical protein DCE93_07775 [Agromyces badenianii]
MEFSSRTVGSRSPTSSGRGGESPPSHSAGVSCAHDARHTASAQLILIDTPLWPKHGTVWAHLVSDESIEELRAFADRAGLPARSFDLDHYDVPVDRYDDLVAAGAVAVSPRELVERLRRSGLRVTPRERRERAARPSLG